VAAGDDGAMVVAAESSETCKSCQITNASTGSIPTLSFNGPHVPAVAQPTMLSTEDDPATYIKSN